MTTSQTEDVVARHFRGLRGVPHAEVVFIYKDDDGGGGTGVCYNTLGLPTEVADDQFRSLDPEALKADFKADALWINGPRRAQMDEASAEILDGANVTPVGGIPMWIVAKLHIPDLRRFAAERPAYTETPVRRTTRWTFSAGRPVCELVSPAGDVYAMQSASLIKDPHLDEQLPTLGERLQLPKGWQYRTRTLDEDLTVRAVDGIAHVVLDEFENNYQRED
jgi:hypothetical protein